MRSLEEMLVHLMCHITPDHIFQERLGYDRMTCGEFCDLLCAYSDQYIRKEAEGLFYAVRDKVSDYMQQHYSHSAENDRNLSVFTALVVMADDLFLIYNDKVVCHYEKFLDWRRVAVKLSENMFIAAYLANRDIHSGLVRTDFAWDTTVGHNNTHLNRIVERGISENHFHLMASAPYFHLSWITLMNVLDADLAGKFKEISTRRQRKNILYRLDYSEQEFSIQHLQAALIRIYLFTWLNDIPIEFENYKITFQNAHLGCTVDDILQEQVKLVLEDWQITEDCLRDRRVLLKSFEDYCMKNQSEFYHLNAVQFQIREFLLRITLKEEDRIARYQGHFDNFKQFLCDYCGRGFQHELFCFEPVMDAELYRRFNRNYTENLVYEWLKNPRLLKQNQRQIQRMIWMIGEEKQHNLRMPGEVEDYVLPYISTIRRSAFDEGNQALMTRRKLSGENWFLYQMFYRILGDTKKIYARQYNLFYAYLVLKENLRSEMLQTNGKPGLENFIRYDHRHGYFLLQQKHKEQIWTMAIADTLKKQYLKHLEIRIKPADSSIGIAKQIYVIDGCIRNLDQGEELLKRFYYVLHFSRRPDHTLPEKMPYSCRHAAHRKDVMKRAAAIARVRVEYPYYARRILGIDVCSQEIGCRPEVFAQAFRFLRNHSIKGTAGEVTGIPVPQLKVTYHVGEEFLDISDGLRAIDEVVYFLNLDCGDRFGHALVLGEDIENWYAKKQYRVHLTIQDYMDNLAWVYGKIVQFHLDELEGLKNYVEKEFSRYFRLYYLNNMDLDIARIQMEIPRSMQFTIGTYYESWMLRGDNPECYWEGKFQDEDSPVNRMDHYKVNRRHPGKYDLRNIPEVVLLYHSYHFNEKIKQDGMQKIEVEVPRIWITGMKILQEKMQSFISGLGIGIESNPSSNISIGQIEKYDEHPIVKWYNHHLVSDPQKIAECPQLSVSINTDDQGTFSTSLENEYALMACSLEQARTKEDMPVYDRMMVYEWLDDIRKFGNLQSFQDETEE